MTLLAVLGLLISIYLVQHHYALANESGFCDMSQTVSCSIVHKSSYAELFHIPIAFYGAFWFLVFLILLGLVYLRKARAKHVLLLWSSTGFLFVFYLLYAEWQLGAICPWCTVVHGILFFLLPLTICLYRKRD